MSEITTNSVRPEAYMKCDICLILLENVGHSSEGCYDMSDRNNNESQLPAIWGSRAKIMVATYMRVRPICRYTVTTCTIYRYPAMPITHVVHKGKTQLRYEFVKCHQTDAKNVEHFGL